MAVNTIEVDSIGKIAAIIRAQRKKSGLSRNRLALLADVGRTAVFDIEHGKTTYQIDTLFKILHVLNLKLRVAGVVGDE